MSSWSDVTAQACSRTPPHASPSVGVQLLPLAGEARLLEDAGPGVEATAPQMALGLVDERVPEVEGDALEACAHRRRTLPRRGNAARGPRHATWVVANGPEGARSHM